MYHSTLGSRVIKKKKNKEKVEKQGEGFRDEGREAHPYESQLKQKLMETEVD